MATTSGIKVLRTPYQTPRANAVSERFLGSVRRECLDHFLIFGERHLQQVLKAYVAYFNHAPPHQGLGQRISVPLTNHDASSSEHGAVQAVPILGGLHHCYQRAA